MAPSSTGPEHIIAVRDLRKRFTARVREPGFAAAVRSLVAPRRRTTEAVAGISFDVEPGEITAFIGPNGAGKSTTIKLITGILFRDAGSVSVLGMDPQRHRRQLAYRIGTVFGQKSQLWFHLPPLDTFRLMADIYDLPRATAARRIDELSEVFGIGDYLDVPVRKLSLGERIRCEIAASLLHDPEVLFLDEPTIGLDVVVKARIRDLIQRINRERGTTVFLTSHDAGDIEKICRRAIVINHGTIVWDGTIKAMKYAYFARKIIDLKLDAPLRLDLPGVTTVKSQPYAAKLEVDTDTVDLSHVTSRILATNQVVNIAISNPPMEEVISRIYAEAAP